MLPNHPQVPTFYTLPKVHKGLRPLKGSPIVSVVGSVTQNAGIYIDKILRQFILSLPSYLRDSSDLLCKLEDVTLEEGTLLASIDVDAPYSSIPHDFGLKAVSHFLSTKGVQYIKHHEFMLELIEFVLTHNYFTFN